MSTEKKPRLHLPLAVDRPAEADYSVPAPSDYDALSRDWVDVRSLRTEDLADLVRIDRQITGRARQDYIASKVKEALLDSGLRVSLTAAIDGIVAGFIMARLDYGEFGHMEPVATMDTIGVSPDYAGRGVGKALVSQLLANLRALGVERVETSVACDDLALLGFLYRCGFRPSRRLAFAKKIA
ncbi:MAG: GNAT family N-acetyltransferase [Alphaproteobacteria bacterium]|jgi:ribosomal protein S18 acetylase RimI-like enzyme|nr:GNAT family N-acetyltransferase [Alphaproteobacteria bacterium]|tara:strand:- start:39 stop:587 length:549 start_codon:yes stop_codon:yes gene_type:complete